MVEVPGSLACLFSGTVERRGDSYVVEVPANEVEVGSLDVDDSYRVGVFATDASSSESDELGAQSASDGAGSAERSSPQSVESARANDRTSSQSGPPVEEDESRIVTIESVGDEGDGIAKVERGYVIIVDGASVGDTVRIRVHTVTKNVAFADVVEHDPTPTR